MKPEKEKDASSIKAVNMTKRFGMLTAVDSVSFQVEKGEIFGIVGPDGAGKTTALRMLIADRLDIVPSSYYGGIYDLGKLEKNLTQKVILIESDFFDPKRMTNPL